MGIRNVLQQFYFAARIQQTWYVTSCESVICNALVGVDRLLRRNNQLRKDVFDEEQMIKCCRGFHKFKMENILLNDAIVSRGITTERCATTYPKLLVGS